MVTIITEKLRNQSLDDVKVEAVPALQTTSNTAWAFSTSPSSAFQLTGDKGWTMFLDPKERWPEQATPGQPTPGTTAKTSVAARPGGGTAERTPHSALLYSQQSTQASVGVSSCPSSSKFTESCAQLESIPSTPPAPPMKRHCSSLSVSSEEQEPEGSPTATTATTTTKWEPHAGQIWRPVASRSHNNKLKTRNSSGSGLHRPTASRGSPHPGPVGSRMGPLPGHAPTAPGAASGIWPLSKSDDFSTPPDSPVPRPASASSGFCDSLVNSSWLEKAATGPNTTDTSTSPGGNANNPEPGAYRLRSLSMDEPIFRLGVGRGACSMPAIPGSNRAHHSTPSSPRRQRVQRCRSQPCVLHDRKCLKRRRDEDRPALDFLKMTETAYNYGGWKNNGRSVPHTIRWSRSLASLFSTDTPHCGLGLNTIASSPLDGCTLPVGLTSPSSTADRMVRTAADSHAGPAEQFPRRSRRVSASGRQQRTQSDSTARTLTPASDGVNRDVRFVDSGERCDCHDTEDMGHEADGEMFELEMNNDLDLDQIEKD